MIDRNRISSWSYDGDYWLVQFLGFSGSSIAMHCWVCLITDSTLTSRIHEAPLQGGERSWIPYCTELCYTSLVTASTSILCLCVTRWDGSSGSVTLPTPSDLSANKRKSDGVSCATVWALCLQRSGYSTQQPRDQHVYLTTTNHCEQTVLL